MSTQVDEVATMAEPMPNHRGEPAGAWSDAATSDDVRAVHVENDSPPGGKPQALALVVYSAVCGALDLVVSGLIARLVTGSADGTATSVVFFVALLALGALAVWGSGWVLQRVGVRRR